VKGGNGKAGKVGKANSSSAGLSEMQLSRIDMQSPAWGGRAA